MKMKKTLVVVDMQDDFLVHFQDDGANLVDRCKRLIKLASKRGWSIVFLEFNDCGETVHELTSAALNENHCNVFFATKDMRDGSKQVETLVWKNELPTDFVVCGIFTEQCVISTVKGLHVRMPESKIALAWEACGAGSAVGHYRKMQKNVPAEFHKQLKHELELPFYKRPSTIVKIVERCEEL